LIIPTNLSFAEWMPVFGDEKMTAALLDRVTQPCGILETGDDPYRLKQRKKANQKPWPLQANWKFLDVDRWKLLRGD
jgi:IstB-like ATP binding protein